MKRRYRKQPAIVSYTNHKRQRHESSIELSKRKTYAVGNYESVVFKIRGN